MNRVSDCSNLKLYDRILRIRSSVCRVAGSSTRLVGNWSLLLFVCGVLCLPVMSVIAASSNSDNQAARERDQIIEDSIAIAGTKHVFSSAQDFIRESCQQVTREEFDSNSITLPVAWQAYSDSSGDYQNQPATEPVERRGQQVGTRYSWQSRMLDKIELSVLGSPDRPLLTLQLGEEFPVLRLFVRGDCSVVNVQRVEYRRYTPTTEQGPSRMLAYQLQSLDDRVEVIGEPQLLNPEV